MHFYNWMHWQLAEEQGVLQHKVIALETEVERHDTEIRNLQKQLKEAEQLLVRIISLHLLFLIYLVILANIGLQIQNYCVQNLMVTSQDTVE